MRKPWIAPSGAPTGRPFFSSSRQAAWPARRHRDAWCRRDEGLCALVNEAGMFTSRSVTSLRSSAARACMRARISSRTVRGEGRAWARRSVSPVDLPAGCSPGGEGSEVVEPDIGIKSS